MKQNRNFLVGDMVTYSDKPYKITSVGIGDNQEGKKEICYYIVGSEPFDFKCVFHHNLGLLSKLKGE